MLVQQILSGKPSEGVTTVTADQTISEAAAILSDKRIGALIVSKTGTDVEGILSERDIVRDLGLRGSKCMLDKVGDLMTSKIISCKKSDTVETVMQMMSDGRFRHMPVMEGDTMLGVISIGDVVKARLAEISHEKDALVDMIKGY